MPKATPSDITTLDRPTGIVFDEKRIAVTLAHSGDYAFGVMAEGQKQQNDIIRSARDYRLCIRPFVAAEEADAVWWGENHWLRPVTVPQREGTKPEMAVSGKVIVSGLYREGETIVLRMWNPFEESHAKVKAPGMTIKQTNLEGKVEAGLGRDEAQILIGQMGIRTLSLERTGRLLHIKDSLSAQTIWTSFL